MRINESRDIFNLLDRMKSFTTYLIFSGYIMNARKVTLEKFVDPCVCMGVYMRMCVCVCV